MFYKITIYNSLVLNLCHDHLYIYLCNCLIFHTFNYRLLELIKIRTLNLTDNELLGYIGIIITFKVGGAYVF